MLSTVSPQTLEYKIRRHQEELRSLKRYMDFAVNLPDTEDKYTKEFCLTGSTKKLLDAEIKDSLSLNQIIKNECEQFEKTTFTQMVELLGDVSVYARQAEANIPLLLSRLEALMIAKRQNQDVSEPQDDVKFCLARSGNFPGNVKDKANIVSDGLGTFAKQCGTSAYKVDLELKAIHLRMHTSGKEDGELTRAVNRLRALAEAPRMDVKLCWAPLVGDVPQSVLEDNACKILYRHLSSNDPDVVRERISLTCKMMTFNWRKIIDLLEPAKHAVQDIHGFFDVLQARLKYIESTVADLEQQIPGSRIQVNTLIDAHQQSWHGLCELVDEVLGGIRLAHQV